MATKDELRRQLNLKNLQRHDPSIDRIVASTSYASIYDNKGHGWVKTGVEGPMFLFSRTTAPHYGFFVLNRNGLEYVQEFLTPESEVQVGGEFILYESGKDADRATGIWVFEEKERHELCRQMEQVRARAASSEGAKATAPGLPRGKPISVDMLFSAAASPTPTAATLPAQQQQSNHAAPAPPPTTTAGMNPLDALFASATMSPRPAAAAAPASAVANPQPQPQRLPATLEQLFAAASPTPQAARLPTQQQQQPAQAQSPPTSVASPGGGGGGGMALLDSIFAAAAENSSPRPAAMRAPAPAPAPAAAAPPYYNTAPYSPQTQVPTAASRPAPLPTSPPPPPPPQQQPAPRDARDLLAMLGGIGSSSSASMSGSGSVPSPRAAAAAAAAGSNDMLEPELGRSSPVDLSTKPHTTVHPQGFSMDVQPGTIAPDLVTSTSPTPVPVPEDPVMSPPTLPGREPGPTPPPESKGTSKATTPMFAPPVLSHDIFASLPLPGGSSGGGGKAAAAIKEEENLPSRRRNDDGPTDSISTSSSSSPPASAPRPDSQTQSQSRPDSSATAPTKEEAEEEEATGPIGAALSSPSPSSTTTGGPQRQTLTSSLLIDKSELVSRVDGILTKSGVGMTPQANGNSNPDGPMSKEEFVAEALKAIQKPSFLMQLYGRYLERYEEANE